MAEGIFKHMIENREDGLKNIKVMSAGTCAWEGDEVALKAVAVLKEKGIDISSYRSTPLTPSLLRESDLILTMTQNHKAAVAHMCPGCEEKVYTLKEYVLEDEEKLDNTNIEEAVLDYDIKDPYGQSLDIYRSSARDIEEQLQKLAELLGKTIVEKGELNMKIAIGSDHGGYELKEIVKNHLQQSGYNVKDFGTNSAESVDYPDFAKEVGESVVAKEYDKGILICGTGIGISIAANKIPGVRCALLSDCFSARATREHNDSNIMALGGRVVGPGLALQIVDTWLGSQFEGGRHQNRIDKITQIENKYYGTK